MKAFRWGALLFLAGCASLKPLGSERQLLVYPHFSPQTQTIVNPASLSSIATLDIVPYKEFASGSFSPISAVSGNTTTVGAPDMLKLSAPAPIDTARPFILKGLRPNTNYRIYGRAYNASNTLISQDSGSYVDVSVGTSDTPPMAQLPVNLFPVPFGATASVLINTDGRFDYLSTRLYQDSNNQQVATLQVTRPSPDLVFSNLQGNTRYRLAIDAYKLGSLMATASLTFDIGTDTTPATFSTAITIPWVVSTLAGSGSPGYADGVGSQATFRNPFGVAANARGDLYVADAANHSIRKVTPAGQVTTFVGNGTEGYVDGNGTNARFKGCNGVAFDPQGNLYVADTSNHVIRKVSPAGDVVLVAGNGNPGYADAVGNAAYFRSPESLAFNAAGVVYLTETGNHAVRRITSDSMVTNMAGNGYPGYAEGINPNSQFNEPRGVAVDSQGNAFIADYINNRIRKLTPAGVLSTFAGNGTDASVDGTGLSAGFGRPIAVAFDPQGNLYVSDHSSARIRKVTPAGVVTTLAGSSVGFTNGTGTSAKFSGPLGIAVDPLGRLFVADYYNHSIRMLQ